MKNIIFDVDRTLVDSYHPELTTLQEALYLVTGKHYESDVMDKLTVLTTDEFFRFLGIDDDAMLKQINYHWGRLLQNSPVTMFTGIPELLTLLAKEHYFLGIATSRTWKELEEIDDLMKILSTFDCVITSDKVDKPKPNPESILTILKQNHLQPSETIYVGDSESYMLAAKSAGVFFAYASWDNHDDSITYDYILNTPEDLKKLLTKS